MLKNSPGVFNPLEVEVLSLHRTKKQLQKIQFIHLRSNCTFCRVCQCSLVPCATISTIVASTTSSWSTLGKEQHIFRMNKWKTLWYTKLSYWLVLHHRSPLASIYSTSTMENHHFNMAINILQQVSYSFTHIHLLHQNIKIWNKSLTLILICRSTTTFSQSWIQTNTSRCVAS